MAIFSNHVNCKLINLTMCVSVCKDIRMEIYDLFLLKTSSGMDQLLRRMSRKRKLCDEDDEEYNELFRKPARNYDDNTILFSGVLAAAEVFSGAKKREIRKRNEERVSNWWHHGYLTWTDTRFKQHFRITRDSFESILNIVTPIIKKTPTNLCPNPTSPATQLALTLYRLAHGTSYSTTGALFGVSEELACVTFNAVCKVLVGEMYDDYVKLPDDWEAELRGFLENFEFPGVGGMGWLSRLLTKRNIQTYFAQLALSDSK